MHEVRFEFIAAHESSVAGVHDARRAAAILANCLGRQGYVSQVEGNAVTVMAPRRSGQANHIYVVLDEALLMSPGLLGHLDSESAVIVCSARPARVLLHELGRYTAGLASVDADGIATDEGSDAVIAMLGGAARMFSFIDPEVLSTTVWATYDRSFPYAAQAAIRTFDLGYMQAQQAM